MIRTNPGIAYGCSLKNASQGKNLKPTEILYRIPQKRQGREIPVKISGFGTGCQKRCLLGDSIYNQIADREIDDFDLRIPIFK